MRVIVVVLGLVLSTVYGLIGAKNAAYGRYPHQVSIRVQGVHECSGSIISEYIIVTAAHCVYSANISAMTIVASTNRLHHGGTEFKAIYAEYHESYDRKSLLNDIAIIKVASPIRFDELEHPIKLARSKPEVGEKLRMSGWGLTHNYDLNAPERLKDMQFVTLNMTKCLNALRPRIRDLRQVDLSHICTKPRKGKGTCYGDSGGPLINYKEELVGICSWSIPCASGYPDVYTSVPYFVDWIEQFL